MSSTEVLEYPVDAVTIGCQRNEVLSNIFSFLKNEDLKEVMLVSFQWNQVAERHWTCKEVLISKPEDLEALAWNRLKRVTKVIISSNTCSVLCECHMSLSWDQGVFWGVP